MSVKYRAEFYDKHRDSLKRVDVEDDNFVGTIISLRPYRDAVTMNYNPEPWVQPSELLFSFIVNRDDISSYDTDFFDGEHHKFKVKYYVGGILKWVGWLKPENTNREFLYVEVVYRVSATDGVNELKEIDYDGFYLSGKQTILQIIKNAISFIEIDDLDFHIQCGIYEDELMTSDENLFDVLSQDNRRFYNEEDGELVPMKCFDVIVNCIKQYYCDFRQSGGYWRITNGQEYVAVNESVVQSKAVVFDYTTLAEVNSESELGYGRVVALTESDIRPHGSKWELSKQPPLKKLRITFRNKNLGGNELTNGDFSNGTTGWNNGANPANWYLFDAASGGGEFFLNLSEPTGVGDPNVEKYIESDNIGLDKGDGEGYIQYVIDLELDNILYNSGSYLSNPPYMYVQMIDPDGTVRGGFNRIVIQQGRQVYTTLFPTQFPLDKTGNWKIRVTYVPNSGADLTVIALKIYEIQVLQNATEDTTFDTVYINVPAISAYKEEEIELLFADSIQATDAGAIFRVDSVTSNLTSSWSRFFAVSSSPDILAALLVYLPFSGNADDESGYNHTVNLGPGLNGSPSLTTDRNAVTDMAYEWIAAENDAMTVDYNAVFNVNYITILCWVYLETGGVERGIVFRAGSFALRISANNTLIFQFTRDSGGVVIATSPSFAGVSVQTWTHIAVKFSGNRVAFYINGVFEYNIPVTSSVIADNTNEIRIGEDFGTGFFNGKIDEVVIYGRALSDEEVEGVYNFGPLSAESTGETEQLPLWKLLAQQYLNDRQGYFNRVAVNLYDLTDRIEYNDILEFQSKYYKFIDYSKNYNEMLISGNIQQVSFQDVPFSASILQLSSVDGKSTKAPLSASGVINQYVYETIINEAGDEFSFVFPDSTTSSEPVGVPEDDLIVLSGLMISGSVRCFVRVTVTHDGSTASANVQRTPATSATSIFRDIITGATIDSVQITIDYTNNSGGAITFTGLLQKF